MNHKLITSILMLPLLASIAVACSCIYLPDAESKLDNAKIVFTGKITNLEQLESYPVQYRAHFEVDNYWKRVGISTDENNLIVNSIQNDGANCGYDFVQGQNYLIYAYIDEETGRIETNSCMGSLILSEATNEIQELNSIVNPTQPTTEEQPESQNVFSRFFSWLKNIFS